VAYDYLKSNIFSLNVLISLQILLTTIKIMLITFKLFVHNNKTIIIIIIKCFFAIIIKE